MTAPNSGSGTDSNADPNNTQDSGSGILGSVGTAVGTAISGVGSTIAAPFTNWFNTMEADVMNILNQSMNSIFYSLVLLGGVTFIVWGLYLLFKDSAPVEGLTKVVGTAAAVL